MIGGTLGWRSTSARRPASGWAGGRPWAATASMKLPPFLTAATTASALMPGGGERLVAGGAFGGGGADGIQRLQRRRQHLHGFDDDQLLPAVPGGGEIFDRGAIAGFVAEGLGGELAPAPGRRRHRR